MSTAIRGATYDFLIVDDPHGGLPTQLIVSARWIAFAAIWWDIGLVATPTRAILAAASVAHDAVDEWRDEFPNLLHDVPCCFRITRHTWSRQVDVRSHWARNNPGFKRDVRNTLRAWERKAWPPLPGRNDYRGNVRDTAWLQDARPWLDDVSAPLWNTPTFVREAATFPREHHQDAVDISFAAESMLGTPSAGGWSDMQPIALPPSAPNCRCTVTYFASSTRVARWLTKLVSKTPRQRLDRAGKQRRKRGRR